MELLFLAVYIATNIRIQLAQQKNVDIDIRRVAGA